MPGTVTIIDYGVGNIASIANMLRKADVTSKITSDVDHIAAAEKILLPGVGSFDTAAIKLRELSLGAAIVERAKHGVPVLGVCLGMQLLLDSSEEGTEPGLGLIAGQVRKFPRVLGVESLRVPHMGWNTVHREPHATALPDVEDGDRFYFVHSYYADPESAENVLATTTHGIEFASMINHANVTGVQFHPEKSHRIGLRLLTDFARA